MHLEIKDLTEPSDDGSDDGSDYDNPECHLQGQTDRVYATIEREDFESEGDLGYSEDGEEYFKRERKRQRHQKLQRKTYTDDSKWDALRLFEGGAPRLTQVKLSGLSFALPHRAAHLVELHIVGKLTPPYFNVHQKNHRHNDWFHCLRVLRISGPHDPDYPKTSINHLLSYLKAPLLDTLEIDFSSQEAGLSVLTRILASRTSPAYNVLQSLHLHSASLNLHDAEIITHMLPSVAHISLNCSTSLVRLFRWLLPDGDRHPCILRLWGYVCQGSCLINDNDYVKICTIACGKLLWPKLRSISLSWVEPLDLNALCDVIADRKSRDIPIACVSLTTGAQSAIPSGKLAWMMRQRVRIHTQSF